MRRSAPAALPLLAGVGALAGILGWHLVPYLGDPGWVTPGRAAESPAPVAAADDVPEPAAPAAPGTGHYAVIAARNLFAPGRAPVPEAAGAAPMVPDRPAPPALGLAGILLTADGGVAILRPEGGSGETLRLVPGETHQGWRLERLTARSATFARDGAEHTLTLDFAAPALR